MSGAILNTINTRLNARTVSVLLRHSEAKLVFVDCQSCALIDEALSLFPKKDDQKFPLLVFIDDGSVEEGKSLPPSSPTYERLIEMGSPDFKWVRPDSEWDPMILNYTSRTTSAPKGVVHCHRGIFVVAMFSVVDWALPKQPVYLWTLPMFHSNGWSFPWVTTAVGGTNICLRRFDAATVYAAIKRHRIMTGGAPPPAEVLSRTEALGFSVSHGYGMTETAGISAWCSWKPGWGRLSADERARLKVRQGVRTLAMTEVDVLEPITGEGVKQDGETLGEVVMRGGSVMLGYLNDPEATAKSIRANGWFYTGDVGVMHADGYVEIKDRSKDVIISGGENISSVEVESVLYTHPAVNEAPVVARPDEFWGETSCAFVGLKEQYRREGKKSAPSEAEIIGYCRERMARYMVPKTVVFEVELPKTSTGKMQKFVLRDMAKALGGVVSVWQDVRGCCVGESVGALRSLFFEALEKRATNTH
ncbi:putative acyl-activating enzyme 5, peroxisomal [Acorus calamus]|uniref:Acyl-activating enzyme 5, peroxisomal n=1 Tax=Acorus calamus TaxID=4465 RepID=A0AAV9F7V8_ACOCL|nr:putative acyl-activating enzyme 5, peroxisomal [Acorus calamus]